MSKPIYTIYKHTCIITNKSYIGLTSKGIDQRWKQHLYATNNRSTIYFHKSIRKHGKENFIHEILFETTDQSIINEKEIEYIAEYDTFNNGYNMNEGGGVNYGYRHTQETKEKMSIDRKGKPKSKKHTENKSGKHHWNYDKHHSEETKLKIKASSLGRIQSKKQILQKTGKNSHKFKGYYHTPWGKFKSSRLATNKLTKDHKTVLKWCKNPDIIICYYHLHSPYLQSLKESPLGKTFRELGFWFEPK